MPIAVPAEKCWGEGQYSFSQILLTFDETVSISRFSFQKCSDI